ncbi:prolipoprotein diacylglyceryl transferase [Spiroplasma culicicola]|uniref:Prolipoprotein diacylglyceryl transferase n=1 Tax=Spiroplasma culicicola AES-1 TaxID=1276246 RepID=W6A600_9MOLU|nr:prolipoprotein diacylglyceryl transferase family protein [Spiroplasma culicicola]AHI52422.1 prolipoprotein diacylglyceryl transferase [Spiroplasma culicicola AES-1]
MEEWQGSWFSQPSGIWSVDSEWGFIHIYALTMTLGVLVAIAMAAIQFKRKGINTNDLLITAIVAVPMGLFGGSFFGKLNAQGVGSNAGGVGFWGLFAFWEPGMSIHGALLFGAFSGILIVYIIGRKTRVSTYVYMDCILPNILISQAIGRWGNFFNHEIVGKPLGLYNDSSVASWMPAWLRDNLTFRYTGGGPSTLNGVEMINGENYVMTPLFLIESITFLVAWIIIVFIIPGFGRWISKKPWKINSQEFSFSWKYSWKRAFFGQKEEGQQTYFEVWDKAYYKNKNEQSIEAYKQEYKNINEDNYLKRKWKQGVLLEKSNNPEGYTIIKAGVQAGMYFFFWNLIRFSLELVRPIDHLFLNNLPMASYVLVGLTMVFGLGLAILCQFVTPYLFRKPGFLFEKQYFYTEEVIDQIIKTNNPSGDKPKVEKNSIDKKALKEQKAKEKLDKILNKNK